MILTDSIETTEIGAGHKNLQNLQDVLYRYCLSITGSSWDAEDLSQDTWLKAIGKLKCLGHTNPEAFLLRIAKNTWIDQSRRKSVLIRILKQEQPKVTLKDNGLFEIETAFQALMKYLSPLQRSVFLLREVFGLSIGETAEKLETTEGAVKAALHRARQSLEAVKVDLENDELPLPKEEELKALLRAFAFAYQMGDIATLVELTRRGKVVPAVVTGIVQDRLATNPFSVRLTDTLPSLQMAA